MPIETDSDGRDDNEGPHCRNCHIGANNCDVCHNDDSTVSGNWAASASWGTTPGVVNDTSYVAQSYIKQSASVGTLAMDCIDGGFSYPHRTLGANMLKDELYGIDFDGEKINFTDADNVRGVNGGSAPDSSGMISLESVADGTDFVLWTGENRKSQSIIPAVSGDNSALELTAVENLDSVCIDCHGDGTYWNGDVKAAPYYKTHGASTQALGVFGSGQYGGWELLLKGLP